jgi:hypothetical protein
MPEFYTEKEIAVEADAFGAKEKPSAYKGMRYPKGE